MKHAHNKTIPQHIAIIMDGNRRWARKRGLPIIAGHRKVADKMLEPLVEHAAKKGVKFITFWAFSTENWQRNKKEIAGIIRIFRHVVRKRWQKLHEKGVRVEVIGDISKFPADLQTSLAKVVEETKNNQTITAVFALNYGGRDEIVRAINRVISRQTSDIRQKHDQAPVPAESWKLTTESFTEFLDTFGIPDPDMIVRTGGEQRLSGFLLWQSQYSELFFAPWYMPEFTPEKLDVVIEEFAKRQRRYGR